MNYVTEFIQSGVLELYGLGVASPEEAEMVAQMAAQHAEIRQELENIAHTLEAYALAHAVAPKATVKPLVLATINYLERLKSGEPITEPPLLSNTSEISDFASWLNRPDMVLPPDAEAIFAKIIGATPAATTAIVWLTGMAENEVHHHEYERFLILEGTCDITVGEETHHLGPGVFFAIPLHVNHHVKVTSATPCKAILQRIAA